MVHMDKPAPGLSTISYEGADTGDAMIVPSELLEALISLYESA